MKTEQIPGIDDMNVLSPEVYDTMYPAEIVFVNGRDDLAVIRFSTEESLSSVDFAEKNPTTGDRIMCIGNPQNEWFAVSYGKVTSGIERFGEFTGFPSNAMKHSAYIYTGSSGGAALKERMELIGITPGAAIAPDGKFINGVLTPVSEIRLCLEEWVH